MFDGMRNENVGKILPTLAFILLFLLFHTFFMLWKGLNDLYKSYSSFVFPYSRSSYMTVSGEFRAKYSFTDFKTIDFDLPKWRKFHLSVYFTRFRSQLDTALHGPAALSSVLRPSFNHFFLFSFILFFVQHIPIGNAVLRRF